MDQSPVYIIFT